MKLTLDARLEATLNEVAQRQGLTPEAVALQALRDRFLPRPLPIEPRDDWERQLLQLGKDCGVSLSDEAISSEGIYD